MSNLWDYLKILHDGLDAKEEQEGLWGLYYNCNEDP